MVHVDGEALGELALGLLKDGPAVGEGFGGPYMSGSTDVGTGIVYALLFITLLTFARPPERLSLDRVLVPRSYPPFPGAS